MRAILIVGPDETVFQGDETAEVYVRVVRDGPFEAAMALNPAGLAIPVPEGGRDVARLGACLAVHEAEAGLVDGATRILAMVETAAAAMALPSLVGSSPRLCAIAWDAEALARDIGAPASRDSNGVLILPLALVRSQVLLVAAAAGVTAIDTACLDDGALIREVEAARRDGFGAKIARGGQAF